VNGYEIDPTALRQAAKSLGVVGEQLSSQWNALMSTVQGMGEPWGGDDIGMLIGMSYLAVQDVANESYTSAAQDLAGYAEKLTAVADNHERNEQESAAAISAISVPSADR
jgi:uncharacterized protein YukE